MSDQRRRLPLLVGALLALSSCAASTPELRFPDYVGKPYSELKAALAASGVDISDEKRSKQFGQSVLFEAAAVEISLNDDDRVRTIFVFSHHKRGTYRGPLFDGLSASDREPDIVGRFGKPHEGKKARKSTGPLPLHRWIKYRRPKAQVHFEFLPDGRLRQLTLMPADWKPGSLIAR